ncbi:uncharacterized protein LOC116028853 isoform X2 [Ipomoea triloba]|uniref:uncharacterized protein LOC116028853 isoform X2 n=1 Tax=Ipomoea triloba TaxID=35885 RepID=UPI00125E6592|nr:uncharacterized protein LOC116028853 isoform X2 [Ipomoea triloba]
MVGMMAAVSREKVADLLNSSKLAAAVPSQMGYLRQLRDELSDADSILLTEFLPLLLDFVSGRFSPVRKFTIEMLSPIGIRHIEFLPAIIPLLITALKDDTPAVARQSITCGIEIFRSMLFKVAIQGLYSSELDDLLETSWAWVQKFMDEIYTVAFQPALDGRSLLAIKFVESVILLYTPNPNVSSEPPSDINAQGNFEEFNISWLRGGHPILKVGELSAKASNSLSLLLDQLRFPAVKSLSNLMIIVLINSLSAIATKRPAFYGRILPVLMGLDPSTSDSNGKHVYAVHHSLKNAFLSCLNCTHPGSAPWRDRLIGALREMKPGVRTDHGEHQVCQTNGKVEPNNELCPSEDAKPSIKTMDAGCNISGAKRPVIETNDNSVDVDGEMSRKRVKPTPAVLEGKEELSGQQDNSSSEPTTSRTDSDNSAVQQLVAMFGSLVAQGDKAQSLLEMLISSISGDLLAEVVMANMRNVPPNRPNAEEDDDLLMAGSHLGASTIGTGLKQLSLLLTDYLSQPSTLQQNDIPVDAQFSLSSELEQSGGGEEQPLDMPQIKAASDSQDYSSDQAPKPVSFSEGTPSIVENIPVIAPEVADVVNMGNAIPGIDSFSQNDGSAGVVVPLSSSTDLDEASQEHVSGLARSDLEALPSISTDRSEELSPKAAVTDATNIQASTATSVEPSPQLVLPKMSAPVVNLSDEQRDNLQKSVLVRVIDAYKQVAVAGGSHARLSILAHLAVKLPSELDAWKMLQVHILSDYVNHEGHELTLRVLYRLYGQAEEDQDFFSSTAAASAYEMFLLTVAETLRDSFPASDKSLSRLLGDAPHLPNSIFKLLECLCCPGSSANDDKELYSGDRVTQGLSAVWSLILLRPPIRNTSLNIALQSAAHHLEEVRMKAIRLVANRLYPLPSISQQIETFANEMLLSLINVNQNTNSNDDGTITELQQPSTSAATKEVSSDTHQSSTSESISSSSVAEAQRCMSLYFALCTKKHSLFRHIFITYKSGSKAVKQAIDGQIPMLVRTIGSSSELLEIISDPPNGSEELLIQVLRTLTEGTVPSPELIALVKQLYETKVKDVEILLPVLPFLSKEEVLLIFPHLVNAPLDIFQAALSRVLEGSSHSGPMLTPAEALIAIHGIDPDRDRIPLKKVTDACNACFDQRQTFTQQVLAKVLNQLVEQIPLPLLFMRTVLQAIVAFPSLVDFIMEILSRLVSKQIWKYPKLWVGFVKCAQLTKPQSFSVLLQLPPAQLENALNKVSALKAPLVAHASQPHIKSSLPRSVLVVLGIASDSQSSSQAQPPQPPTDDKESSDKEAVTEVSKESSAAS